MLVRDKIPNKIIEIILTIICSFMVVFPTNPLNMPYPSRDSGVFLYIGWRILNEEVPYSNIWDHKPPFIYYIDALGLAVTRNSRWGVWFIEFLSLSIAVYFFIILMRKAIGLFPSILSLILWLTTLVIIQGGNLTTEYTIPLQIIVLWLIYSTKHLNFTNWRWLLIGLLCGIAFFLKQTSIGIWISILIYWCIESFRVHKIKTFFSELLFFFAGVLCIGGILIVYFNKHGILLEFYNNVFQYNLIYSMSKQDFLSRIKPFIIGIEPLSRTGLLQISMIGYLLGTLILRYRPELLDGLKAILYICLIDLPIELFLISLSGRSYPHYYMTLLPCLAFFSGLFFWFMFSIIYSWKIPQKARTVFLLCATCALLWSIFPVYRDQVKEFHKSVYLGPAVRYVVNATNPNDLVLLWGAETSVNFMAKRRSPSRFVYQYPLYTQGYVSENMILEFLGDIIRYEPKLIIDTHNPETPMFNFPIQSKEIEQKINTIKCHYIAVRDLPYQPKWTVYTYQKENLCTP